jgi:hypothetical protein
MKTKTLLSMIIGSGVEINLLFIGYSPNGPFVTNYGLPFTWLVRWFDHLMSNQWFWEVNALNFVADIVIWTVIMFILVKALDILVLLSLHSIFVLLFLFLPWIDVVPRILLGAFSLISLIYGLILARAKLLK